MKYPSITTPDVEHDEANILVEFIILNRNIATDGWPWTGDKRDDWGKLVAVVKKLMGPSFGLTAEQIAFYIYKCSPQYINPAEFAKMAVVARRLFERHDIEELHRIYSDRRRQQAGSGFEGVQPKKNKQKSLISFLMELERGET